MPETNTPSASENPERPRLSLRLKKDVENTDQQQTEEQAPAATAKAEPQITKPRLPLKLGNDAAEATAPEEPAASEGVAQQAAAEAPEAPKAPTFPAASIPEVDQPPPPPPAAPEASAEKAAIPAAPPPRRVEAPPPPRRQAPQAHRKAAGATEGRNKEKQHSHFLQVGVVAAILLLCGIGVIYLFTKLLNEEETAPATARQAATVERAPAAAPIRPTGGPAGIFDKVNVVTDQAAVNTQTVNDVMSSSSASSARTTPAPAATQPAASGNQRVQNRVESYPVSLVMPGTTGGRIVIDNVVYRAGDLVEPSMGLRFKTVDSASKRIVFEDESGALYYKSY